MVPLTSPHSDLHWTLLLIRYPDPSRLLSDKPTTPPQNLPQFVYSVRSWRVLSLSLGFSVLRQRYVNEYYWNRG